MENIQYINAKKLMIKNKYKNKWFGADYTVNMYRGCNHGCIYCDSRSSCYQIKNFDQVQVKKDIKELLLKELSSKRIKGILSVGAMSDPYNCVEKKLLLTRFLLDISYIYGWGVDLTTKSNLILRDSDILEKIANYSSTCVKVTITTADDILAKKIEPFASSTSERFQIVKKLSKKGIFVGVLLMPILPFITDQIENIKTIVRLTYENGGAFIYFGAGMTLRDEQRTYYYKKLDLLFPNLRQQYEYRYRNDYSCYPPNIKALYDIFRSECRKYGLLYKMSDIIEIYTKKNIELRLF